MKSSATVGFANFIRIFFDIGVILTGFIQSLDDALNILLPVYRRYSLQDFTIDLPNALDAIGILILKLR
jgi:ABC-type thiamin/hydroxymethylpyrimidine transport system permease subunit